MGTVPVLLMVAIAVVGITLYKIVFHMKEQKSMANRVRSTKLYGHIYPMLKKYDTEQVECVLIQPEGIVIRNLIPLGSGIQYRFTGHGLDTPSPDTLYALAQAIMLDMETLQNSNHYRFRCHTDKKPNGETVVWYDYMMKSARKTELLRRDAEKRKNGQG